MCAFQKNALAYIDKKCMMFDRKGNHAIFLDIFQVLPEIHTIETTRDFAR